MQTTYDANTGDHLFTFEEEVPIVWVKSTFKGLLIFIGGLIGGAIIGFAIGWLLGIIVWGGSLWYLIWWAQGKDGAAKFTTKITANDRSGLVVIDSGYRTQKKGWEAHRLYLNQIASIERKTYDEEEPASMAYYRSQHPNTAASLLSYQVVTLTFTDGQEVNIAWQATPNKAAQIQAETIKFFNGVKNRLIAVQQHEQRLSTLAPGDEPL